MNAVSLLITPSLAKAALKHKKSAGSSKRIEGELPSAPPVAKDVPEWWDETTTVLDRMRTETNTSLDGMGSKLDAVKDDVTTVKDDVAEVKTSIEPESIRAIYEANEDRTPFTALLLDKLENIESYLGIVGVPVGTENEQVMTNKVMDGGEF